MASKTIDLDDYGIGSHCPACKKDNLTTGSFDWDEDLEGHPVLQIPITCLSCGATWLEIYSLSWVVLEGEE